MFYILKNSVEDVDKHIYSILHVNFMVIIIMIFKF
jgi:hypothetical protein